MKNYKSVVCKDGFAMSVQASEFHYCRPKDNKGPYASVEVGNPNQKEELLMPFMREGEDGADTKPTMTYYPYVPSNLVSAIIKKHGGMVAGQLPKLKEEEDVEVFELPIYWASYLINGDASSLEDDEQKVVDTWLKETSEHYDANVSVVDCSEDQWFSHRNDATELGGMCCHYTVLITKGE